MGPILYKLKFLFMNLIYMTSYKNTVLFIECCAFRFKDPQEDLEDCIVNPTDSISVMNVADQIEILEV